MFQYTRLHTLLAYFLAHREVIAPTELTKKLQISQRTLRNDIRNLNEELQDFHACIAVKRGKGYVLEVAQEKDIPLLESLSQEDEDTLDSADKRINHIIMKMLYANDYLRQDDLADEVFVSTNTIINYLKTIRMILANYNLHLQTKANLGYKITGSELDKRHCIIDLMTANYSSYEFTFSQEQKSLLHHINLDHIKAIVMDFNRENNLHFSDYNLKNLILHIALSISRLHVEKALENYEIPENTSLNELLDPLICGMEKAYKVHFTTDEKNYIYSHYASNMNDLLDGTNNAAYIHNLVSNILDAIYESYHFDLRSDMILERDLTHHLQSILTAKYYKQNKKNPLLNTIKNNYILAYEITETALKQAFIHEPFTLTDDEIGYISLHIGAAIERYFDSRYLKHKKALIVYDSGYAAGSFLASKLNTLFKETLEIIGKHPSHELHEMDFENIDMVISTVALPDVEKPVVVVNIPLLRQDIENIANIITMDDLHPVDKIAKFFDDALFINLEKSNKEDIIHTLCEQMHKENFTTDGFEESVLEREARVSTAMHGVALPHPLKFYSTQSKIAVGILKEPVQWSEKDKAPVQIVLLMGLADDAKKDIEKLYDTFVAIMHDSALQKLLLHAHSLSQFLHILKQNISEDAY